MSTQLVTITDLKYVEQLLKDVLPKEVLLLDLLHKAIQSKDGLVEVNY